MENIKEYFIPYEQALALKELRFDEPCFKVYDNLGFLQEESVMDELNLIKLNAPLWQQAFRFFREKYNLHHNVHHFTEQPIDNELWENAYQSFVNNEALHPYYQLYKEAELACLNKLIEIANERNP